MSAAVAGELEALGFEEIEPGLVEDSMTNRRRIKRMGDGDWDWERIVDEDGDLTNLIRVLPPETVTARRIEVALRRRAILENPKDPWSDYVHPDDYPLDQDLPYWVDQRLTKWRTDQQAGIVEEERRPFPTRCTQIRMDGTRCWLWVNKPHETDKCTQHQKLTRQAIERHPAYARMKLLESAPHAVDNLIYLSQNASGEAVRLKASTEILDRAGVRGGVEVDVSGEISHVDPARTLSDRLAGLARRNAPIVTEEPDSSILALPPAEEPVEAELVDDES